MCFYVMHVPVPTPDVNCKTIMGMNKVTFSFNCLVNIVQPISIWTIGGV